MDADGPLMEQPSAPVVVLALGWANGVSALPTIPSTSKINNHHSTIINPSRTLRSVRRRMVNGSKARGIGFQPVRLEQKKVDRLEAYPTRADHVQDRRMGV